MLPITNSSMEEFSSPLFHFPWPFLDNVDEGLFMYHNNAPAPTDPVNGADHGATLIPNKRKHVVMKVPSKRGGKKDRHSKIRTAQGLRDRRIRLSLKVARRFFDLQDMLGFDKASKTIEWLFINSKDATLQLPQAASEESRVEPEPEEKRKRRESCTVATMFNNHLARKRRDKARARARERTKQKLMIRGQLCNEINSSLLEGSVAVIEELWGMTRSSSSSSNFSYTSPDFAAASSGNNVQEQNIPNAMLISSVDSGALAPIPQQLSKTLVQIQI